MDIPGEEQLTKHAGPFPVWVWGVGIGAVLIAVMWYRRSMSGDTTDTGTVTDTGTGDDLTGADQAGDLDDAALFTGNDLNAAQATANTLAAAKMPRTNAAWLRQAVQYLTGKGTNAIKAQVALQRYIRGLPLSKRQDELVSKVLTDVGLPPKPPATVKLRKPKPTPTPTKPTHNPPTKPHPNSAVSSSSAMPDVDVVPRVGAVAVPAYQLHTAELGDTAVSMSQRAYGVTTPFHVDAIQQANSVGTASEFAPGQTVKVPVLS